MKRRSKGGLHVFFISITRISKPSLKSKVSKHKLNMIVSFGMLLIIFFHGNCYGQSIMP